MGKRDDDSETSKEMMIRIERKCCWEMRVKETTGTVLQDRHTTAHGWKPKPQCLRCGGKGHTTEVSSG